MAIPQVTKPLRQQRCECGQLAVVKKSTGFVCANCDRIERMMYYGHGERASGFDFAMQATNKFVEQYGKYLRYRTFVEPVWWNNKLDTEVLSSFNH